MSVWTFIDGTLDRVDSTIVSGKLPFYPSWWLRKYVWSLTDQSLVFQVEEEEQPAGQRKKLKPHWKPDWGCIANIVLIFCLNVLDYNGAANIIVMMLMRIAMMTMKGGGGGDHDGAEDLFRVLILLRLSLKVLVCCLAPWWWLSGLWLLLKSWCMLSYQIFSILLNDDK